MIDAEPTQSPEPDHPSLEINAITLNTGDMAASIDFWTVPGFVMAYGGPETAFTSLRIGPNFVNLILAEDESVAFWGRVILHVASPDEVHRAYIDAGYQPLTEPADAPWGERYFHIRDPSGHEVSFARPLDAGPARDQDPSS